MQAVTVVPRTAGTLRLRTDVAEPRPARGEALVRVLETGVCGTDNEIADGLYGEPPPGSDYLVLGHENLGVVESVPAGCDDLREGDLVVCTVRRPCPQSCRACRSGQNDMCLTGDFRERGIKGLHGFMCERYAESPHDLVPLFPGLRPVGVLMEPMSIVQKGLEQAFRIQQQRLSWDPRRALVLGAGPVGLLAAVALRLRGLEVTVAAQGPEDSPRAALLADASLAYVSTRSTPIEELPERVGRLDLVFEATGAPSVVVPAMRALGPDGVCVLTSVTAGGEEVATDVAGWNREMVLGNRVAVGTVNAGRRHFELGARDLDAAQARFPGWLERLITRRMHPAEAAAALDRPSGDIKTVLAFA